MKHRLSIAVDESTVIKVRELVRSGRFRNKSHAFEEALKEVAKDEL